MFQFKRTTLPTGAGSSLNKISQESDCEQKGLAMGNGAAYVFYTLIANMDAPVKYSDDPDDGTIPRIVGTIIASAPQQAITNTLTN